MIVIARRYGRLANRLILYAHVVAAARAAGVTVANPAFAEYAHHFRHTARDLWCRYPAVAPAARPPANWVRKFAYQSIYCPARLASRLPGRWPVPVLRLRNNDRCDLDLPPMQDLMRSSRLVLLDGWLFRAASLMRDAAPAVREFLQPVPEHEARVAAVLEPLRQSADVVVGVHIRHGDYRTFAGGQFFFPAERYRRWMDQARELLAPNRVAFVLCSDEEHDPEHWRGLTVVRGPGQPVSDLFTLAGCDYLLGPPSTFTYFASYYGQTPGRWFESTDDELTSFSRRFADSL